MGKYFGTDGFRGEAGITLTADHAYKVGRFLGWYYNALRERNGDTDPARIVKYMELAIDVVLYQQQGLLRHFLAVAVDQLNAVIVIRIMAGGNHDATVEVIHARNVSHRRCGGDVEQISICSGSRQASHQTIFKHIGASAGILANDNASRIGVTIALTQRIIIPA